MQVCHELLGKAWDHAQSYVHSGFGIPSEQLMLRMLRHTCEHQVWQHSLQKHSAASRLCSGCCMCQTRFSNTVGRVSMVHVRICPHVLSPCPASPSSGCACFENRHAVQVARTMAQEWSIFKVGTGDMLSGQSDSWAYVLKGRASADEEPFEFEQLTMQRSCLLILEVGT